MSNDICEYKIILIGNEGVGKTSFVKKLLLGKFVPITIPTVGPNRNNFTFNININKNGINENKNFGVNLFDLGGQERYREITCNYIKGSNGIIIIYDITNRNSFDSIENWINMIKQKIPPENGKIKYAIKLIGNKLDLINDEDKRRQVMEEEAKILCEKNNILWGGEKSFKNMNKNELDEMIKEFIKEIYNRIGKIKIPLKILPTYKRKEQSMIVCSLI